MNDWPTCPCSVTIMGYHLDCSLPAHHELDGTDTHLSNPIPDAGGAQVGWSLTMLVTELQVVRDDTFP